MEGSMQIHYGARRADDGNGLDSFHLFGLLPLELKIEVFQHALISPQPIRMLRYAEISDWYSGLPPPQKQVQRARANVLPPLLETSRHIRLVCQPIYYRENVFDFSCPWEEHGNDSASWDLLALWLSKLSPRARKMVRRLRVEAPTFSPLWSSCRPLRPPLGSPRFSAESRISFPWKVPDAAMQYVFDTLTGDESLRELTFVCPYARIVAFQRNLKELHGHPDQDVTMSPSLRESYARILRLKDRLPGARITLTILMLRFQGWDYNTWMCYSGHSDYSEVVEFAKEEGWKVVLHNDGYDWALLAGMEKHEDWQLAYQEFLESCSIRNQSLN